MIKNLRDWTLAAILIVIAKIISYPLTPIVVLFAKRSTGRLPSWFWWMETHDALLPGDKKITGDILKKYGWWAASTVWLLRNNCYALANRFRVDPDFGRAKFRSVIGDATVNNAPYRPGVFVGVISWPGGWAFEVAACWPMWSGKCGQFRMGYKLKPWFLGSRKIGATGMLQIPSLRPWQDRR